MRLSTKKGFSLVELMIVIVIIGVLALIAMPSYRKYTVKAKTSEAYTLLGTMGQGQMTYYSAIANF